MQNIYILVSGKKVGEKEKGMVVCQSCKKAFLLKEEHFQEALVMRQPKHINIGERKITVGLPLELGNVFTLNACPSCGFHNQRGDVFIKI